MLAGLRKMFGAQTEQKGSNITEERLRFDFNCDHKMTAEELKQLERAFDGNEYIFCPSVALPNVLRSISSGR